MFLEESKWILNKVKDLGYPQNILDVGSSDLEYRKGKQSYIAEMYATIEKISNKKIETLDLQAGSGVDYVCDITQKDSMRDLKQYDLVLLSNTLEHIDLKYLENVLENIYQIMKNDAFCIITVPFNIGYHPSPIDNNLRPTPKELKKIVKNYFTKVVCEQITCSHYREPYKSDPTLLPLPIVTCGVFMKKI